MSIKPGQVQPATQGHTSSAASPVPVVLAAIFLVAGVVLTPPVVGRLVGLERLGDLAGPAIWILDLACIAWGGLSVLFRRHQVIANLNLLVVSSALLVAGAETLLRFEPRLLGPEFANGVLTKYSTRPEGIYYFDPAVKMNFMIPNLKTTMYFNGYVWEHHTDALGFRNRQITVPSDIVLLGDSMVYGHGLNFDETLGHYLALQTGLTVTNLARQGDCFFQYAYLLTEYAPLFRPRHVLVFFTENDINDLYGYLSDEELIRFADTPITEIRYPQRLSLEASLEYRSNQNRPFSQALGRSLYVARIPDWLAFRRALTKSQESMMSPTRSVYDPSSIAWRYSRKALMYMQDASSKHGSQLTLVTLPAHDTKLCGVIHGVARELGVPLLDACELRDPNPSWFLTGDGHFSATGTKAMAAIVARSLGR
jgi:hypothetical protein